MSLSKKPISNIAGIIMKGIYNRILRTMFDMCVIISPMLNIPYQWFREIYE